ncbi:glycosyltransferase family 87 protein [Nocardioides daphniae]|uniref:DUF2029 domain-containing protein n=1 Tax=Nocardioides daphniae TaxID=402297 RepID=A0A4P7U9T6_9ACTN|nr:glycosyltransferase family 87 protein [Nocardioides daphniae]QCC76374.1 DUF2029 domain-containing protein [Nocardioides daphniae]GGD07443.1 hypothetical protein GCM10007231_02690 [Nocardioides daphniae]
MTGGRGWMVRQGLLLTVMMLAALYSVAHSVAMVSEWGLGWDAHAYYVMWEHGPYDAPPGFLDAFNYSPAFAQLLWPLTHLPWPLFLGLVMAGSVVALWWLTRPMPVVLRVLMLAICSVQVTSGNIDWVIALGAVVGLQHGGAWVFAALTKVVPTLGPLWFVARGEWRRLGVFMATLAVVVALSYALSPGLWHDWIDFLGDHADRRPGMATDLLPPLWARVVLAVAITVLAARRSSPWLLPVAMVVAAPVPGTGSWALLAAIPRLRRWTAEPVAADVPATPEPIPARTTDQ